MVHTGAGSRLFWGLPMVPASVGRVVLVAAVGMDGGPATAWVEVVVSVAVMAFPGADAGKSRDLRNGSPRSHAASRLPSDENINRR